jgi:hypothetical protein
MAFHPKLIGGISSVAERLQISDASCLASSIKMHKVFREILRIIVTLYYSNIINLTC